MAERGGRCVQYFESTRLSAYPTFLERGTILRRKRRINLLVNNRRDQVDATTAGTGLELAPRPALIDRRIFDDSLSRARGRQAWLPWADCAGSAGLYFRRDRPVTPATTAVAPIWSTRARSGRSLSQPPTMLTVLTQMPSFLGVTVDCAPWLVGPFSEVTLFIFQTRKCRIKKWTQRVYLPFTERNEHAFLD
jgi:hypothetical protein